MNNKEFIQKYEELLNSGYCECNELNCLDNNSPRKILNIMKEQQEEIERLNKFEKWIDEQLTISQVHGNRLGVNVCNICKDKLKELKGSDK